MLGDAPNRTSDPEGEAWDAYVWIEDADALNAEFKSKGVKITRNICDQPYGCRDFDVEDCNGYRLCFGQDIERWSLLKGDAHRREQRGESEMDDRPTCGKGLASNAALPSRLGDLISAMSDVLEAHLPALDITDEPSRVEREVYLDLVREHREAALQLRAIASQMAGYRNLPMGRHFGDAMAAPPVLESFQKFVGVEQEFLTYLQRRIEEDQDMLAAMGAAR